MNCFFDVLRVSPFKLLLLFLVAVISGLYIDYLATTQLGLYITISLFFFVLVYSLFFFENSFCLFVFLTLISPQFSRDLVAEVVASGNSSISVFYTLSSVSLFGFSLSVLGLFYFGGCALINIMANRVSIDKRTFKIVLFITILLFFQVLASYLSFADTKDVGLRAVLSDARMYIIWMFSIFCGVYFSSLGETEMRLRMFFRCLYFSVLVLGMRTICFVVSDFILKDIKLEFSTQPYMAYPFLFSILMTQAGVRKLLLCLVVLFAAISLKRADLAFVFISLFFLLSSFFITRSKADAIVAAKSILYFLFLSGCSAFLILVFAPDVFSFFLYKTRFFTQEIWSGEYSGSVSVRAYELKNIMSDAEKSWFRPIIGRGLGGAFDFRYTGQPFELGVSDYSQAEIESNVFLRPHTFVNYLFLKGGALLLFSYIFLVIKSMFVGYRLVRTSNFGYGRSSILSVCGWFIVFYSFFCLNMFWKPLHSFCFMYLFVVAGKLLSDVEYVGNRSAG